MKILQGQEPRVFHHVHLREKKTLWRYTQLPILYTILGTSSRSFLTIQPHLNDVIKEAMKGFALHDTFAPWEVFSVSSHGVVPFGDTQKLRDV